jgi:penicillin-binding protein 2
MFERRLKLFLGLLVLVTAVLVVRAAQLQIVQREDWAAKAVSLNTHSRTTETWRGRILDFKDKPIAIDRPCVDACVNFRALQRPADPKWVRAVAVERLKSRLREVFKEMSKSKKEAAIADESKRVQADIDAMWAKLAELSKRPVEEIEQARDDVVKRVTMRRHYIWYRSYQVAMKKFEQREPTPGWRRWLIDESAETPTQEQFTTITVAEELADHPILKAISTDLQNELRKHIEQYPGLVLRPGVQRYYPYGDTACHLIGRVARVTQEDLKSDPHVGVDELRQYLPNDSIGRIGLERLAEPLLRGTRGRIETVEGRDGEVGRTEPVPGRDVKTTIDIELQHDITQLFRYAKVLNEPESDTQHGKYVFDTVEMHGGAVVIDVPTGEVRALVSYPTFDLNTFDEKYNDLVADELNQPLWNRATQQALNPGSTVKPIVGLAGIAEGKVGLHEGIECTGFLVLNGIKYPNGRCWTQSMYGNVAASAHHQIPQSDPHLGTFGNADGFLIYPDAIQRSCNVYFETLGDRLKMEGLSKWYNKFGMGKLTGIGITESPGSVPTSYRGPADEKRFATWISAIGQGTTTATPLQMANVAATLARGGVWTRPRLIPESYGLAPTSRPANAIQEDRVDLGLSKEAIAAAKEGMRRVVNTRAGSAFGIVRRDDLIIAGKTGTAETASRVRVRVRDAAGRFVPGDDRKYKYRYINASTPEHPNPEAPWFRGWRGPKKEDGTYNLALKHSWFVGFAPADNPKIAFAVALEHGGSGGMGAGLIAKQMVASLIEHKYLERATNPPADAQPASASQPATAEELLHPIAD